MSEHLQSLKLAVEKDRVAPVYIVSGQENWAKRQAIQLLKDALVPEGSEDFCFEHYYATDMGPVEIMDSALTLSMMAPRKLILVEQCQKWDAKQRKKLVSYAQDPSLDTCLVLDFDLEKTGKMGTLFTIKTDHVRYLAFPSPSPWDLDPYIQKVVHSTGLKMDREARDILADYCGDDFELMCRELEKLKLFNPDSETIPAESVAALTGRTRLVSRFELQSLMARRDLSGTLMKIQDILDSGDTPIGMLSVLARYAGQLLKTKALVAEGITDKFNLAKYLGLPANIAGAMAQEQRAFSGTELKRALKLVSISDDMLKGSRLEGRSILDRLACSFLEKSTWSP